MTIRGRTDHVAWSPDGDHVLLQSDFSTPSGFIRDVRILAANGTSVASHDEDLVRSFWLDSEHVVGFLGPETESWVPEFQRQAQGFVVDLAGTDPAPIAIPYGIGVFRGNGRGAVAIDRFRGYSARDVEDHDFTVWYDGVEGQRLDGFPDSWSADGSKLAVLHPIEPTRGVEGWLEVLSWPGFETLYRDEDREQVGEFAFDPSGGFVAYQKLVRRNNGEFDFFLRIAPLDGGVPADLPLNLGSVWFWTDGSMNTIDDGRLRSWDVEGRLTLEASAPGNRAAASTDGSTVIFWTVDDQDWMENPIIVQDEVGLTEINLPGDLKYWSEPSISPDGGTLYFVTDSTITLIARSPGRR